MLRRIIQKHNKKLRNFFLPRKLIFALTSFHLFSLIAFYSCCDFAFLTISLLFVHIFIFKFVVAQSAGKDKQEYVWIYTEIRWENEKNTIFMCFLFGINIWISKRKGEKLMVKYWSSFCLCVENPFVHCGHCRNAFERE